MYKNAEEMLEQIFHYMNLLIDERDFYNTIRILTDLGRTLVCSDRASFWYWDKEKKQYWTLASSGTDRIVVEEGSGIIGASITGNETIRIDSPYEDSRFNPEVDKSTGYVTKSILCMPVCNQHGDVIGAYQAINKLGGGGFDEMDVKHLAMAAMYCGKILENHLLHRISSVDQLTGLKNRRTFSYIYDKAFLESNRPCMVMCDIDFFKKVNDTYGHNGGDAVLMNVANMLKNYVGENGEVIRWGGEEFILFLKNYELKEAVDLAETLRVRVEQMVSCYEKNRIKVTMSFGVAEVKEDKSCEENVQIADEKLYLAKTGGRNRVVF